MTGELPEKYQPTRDGRLHSFETTAFVVAPFGSDGGRAGGFDRASEALAELARSRKQPGSTVGQLPFVDLARAALRVIAFPRKYINANTGGPRTYGIRRQSARRSLEGC
jgi:hypothetical protein